MSQYVSFGTTTPGQGAPESNKNEEVIHLAIELQN